MDKKNCRTCHLRNQEGRKELIILLFETKITTESTEKDIEFAILQILNMIEITSCYTCLCNIKKDEEPSDNDLGIAFADKGAKILRDKKLPLIIKEVKSPLNMFGAGEEYNHNPTLWEAFKHWLLTANALTTFYENHKEFVE